MRKRFSALLLVLVSVFFMADAVPASAAMKDGWVKEFSSALERYYTRIPKEDAKRARSVGAFLTDMDLDGEPELIIGLYGPFGERGALAYKNIEMTYSSGNREESIDAPSLGTFLDGVLAGACADDYGSDGINYTGGSVTLWRAKDTGSLTWISTRGYTYPGGSMRVVSRVSASDGALRDTVLFRMRRHDKKDGAGRDTWEYSSGFLAGETMTAQQMKRETDSFFKSLEKMEDKSVSGISLSASKRPTDREVDAFLGSWKPLFEFARVIKPEDEAGMTVGEKKRLAISVEPAEGRFSCKSLDPSVVEITRDGLMLAKKAGTARISVEASCGGYEGTTSFCRVLVTGEDTVPLIVEPRVILMEPGESYRFSVASHKYAVVTAEAEVGLTLIRNGEAFAVKADSEGERYVTIRASLPGMREAEARVKVVSAKRGAVPKGFVTDLPGYNDATKALPSSVERVIRNAEAALLFSLGVKIGQGGEIGEAQLKGIKESLPGALQKIQAEINLEGLSLPRAVRVSARADVRGSGGFTLSLDALKALSGIDTLYVFDESGAVLGFDTAALPEGLSRLLVRMKKIGEGFDLSFEDGQGAEVTQLTAPVTVILPPVSKDVESQAAFMGLGDGAVFAGGGFDPLMQGVSFKTSRPGRYSVQALSSGIKDIGKGEAELFRAASYLALRGVFDVKEGDFRAEDPMSRADLTAMLAKLFLTDETGGETSFADIRKTDWFFPYVAAAERLGLVRGMSEQSFMPNRQADRQEAYSIAARILAAKKKHANRQSAADVLTKMPDLNEVSPWAEKEIAFCISSGLAPLSAGDPFFPLRPMTRGEAAVMACRLYEKLFEAGAVKAPEEAPEGQETVEVVRQDEAGVPLSAPEISGGGIPLWIWSLLLVVGAGEGFAVFRMVKKKR